MKILVVTKRYTSSQDILREGVGRPYALFAALRALGHEVHFLLGDYTEREWREAAREDLLFVIRPLSARRFFSFRRAIEERLDCGYDCLVAEGDPIFALLSLGPCKKRGIPLVYDLMDNYEAYDVYRLPFFCYLDRRCLRQADAVVCVSNALRGKISSVRRDGVFVAGNGVDTDQFRPMDRGECRRKLSLPESGPVVGYFGYLIEYKGITLLLRAAEILRTRGFRPTLLLAGKMHEAVKLPTEGVSYHGLVSQREIPAHINACDAVVVPSPSNPYTDYCFPLKVLEGIACNVPVVATALGPVRELLGDDYPWLARPGDPDELARKIRGACGMPSGNVRDIALAHTWEKMAADFEKALRHATPPRAEE